MPRRLLPVHYSREMTYKILIYKIQLLTAISLAKGNIAHLSSFNFKSSDFSLLDGNDVYYIDQSHSFFLNGQLERDAVKLLNYPPPPPPKKKNPTVFGLPQLWQLFRLVLIFTLTIKDLRSISFPKAYQLHSS